MYCGSSAVRRFIPLFFLVIALLSTALVYQRGLSGTFMFDDYPNIVNNAHLAIHDLNEGTLHQAIFSSNSGPLRRPISMLSFALNYYFTDANPFYFKLTNLVIHIVNGIGIFWLTSLLLVTYQRRFKPELSSTHIQWISVAIAAAWLLHPFNLTGVLYVVQRMASLSALFCIWGLALYVRGRMRLLEGRNGVPMILASLLLFTPLAALCKENGALLPILMLVTEFTLFKLETRTVQLRRFLIGFFIISVAVPVAAAVAYVATHPSWLLAEYQNRDFTLSERLMTEARVIWFYLRLIVLPSISEMGLFHDDIVNSHGLLEPVTTLLSIVGIAALLIISIIARKKAPLISFGILFFFACHLLESTVFPFEITHEHRNYLPMFGIVFVMFFYLLYPLKYIANLRIRQVMAVLLIMLFSFNTYTRSGNWSNPFDFAETEFFHHPNSVRNNSELGDIYTHLNSRDPGTMEENYAQAREFYEKTITLDKNYVNGLINLIISSSARHKPIEPAWIEELKRRLEHAPFAFNTGDQLIAMVGCQSNAVCSLPQKDVEAILQAALKNPTATGIKRSMTLSALTMHQINTLHDYPAAVATLYQTIETSPEELEYRLTLIKFLTVLNRKDEAKKQLAILKSMDNLHAYTTEIELQGKLLAEPTK
jgi:protein O-mannosyl-transferase